ncbi:MAG TPA: NADH-quinone oxidoreductase subunit H [Geobacteraceae bacterium]|nr:NADH-quinone oxidoreductase subunit H [Geobacteraceae bacterium]
MNMIIPIINVLLALLLAPLLPGIINRTKAIFAGRTGQPLLQLYYDIFRLLRKGAVYSRTTTWIFRAGPIVGLSSAIAAATLVPFGGSRALLAFSGDLFLFAYLFGLGRFFTVIAALDTGSAFEGMGASREAQFSALAEPVLFLGLVAVARETNSLSLSGMLPAMTPETWIKAGPVLTLAAAAILFVFLTENSRIPVDDPNTHLELTMIHEVMVLDHGGPDFAFIQYGAALKLWIFGELLTGILLPLHTGWPPRDEIIAIALMAALAVAVGIIESTMARLRLVRIPQILVGAGTLALLSLLLALR